MEPIADLASLLVQCGQLSEADATRVRREAASTGRVQIRVLRELALVSDVQILRQLADHLDVEPMDVEDESQVDLEALRWVAQDVADAHLVLPVQLETRGPQRVMRLAMADPLCAHSVQTVERTSGLEVEPLLADASALVRAIGRGYGRIATKLIPRPEEPPQQRFGDWTLEGRGGPEPETQPAHRLEDEASPAQMVHALVNLLVSKGVLASDEFAAEIRRLLREDLEE